MNNSNFYTALKALHKFEEITYLANYSSLPEDWFVIITDIQGSTKAIVEGRYKEVNFVGAMSIIAVLNISKSIDIPFVFGGDGASILIPKNFYDQTCLILANVRELVKRNYGFELRVGVIPATEIYAHSKQILITKYEVSAYYVQAIIKGGGLEYAEYLLKNQFQRYSLKTKAQDYKSVDFSGLECRWEAIPSPKEEILSLLIRANDENSDAIYKDFLVNLDIILGDAKQRNPIKIEDMKLSFDAKKLSTEASLYSNNVFIKFFFILKMMLVNLLGKLLISFKIGEWGKYKERIFQTTDTEKFDDMFRMIVSTDKFQTAKLEAYLQNEYEKNNLTYGIHKSNSSLITCLVFQRHGRHVHFVDGSDGGYALASKEFKLRNKRV